MKLVDKAQNYFKEHKYQKFLAIGGFAAATLKLVGVSNILTSGFSMAGEVAGGIALKNILELQKEPTYKKDAFLMVGGVALSFVGLALPATPITQQIGCTIFYAGFTSALDRAVDTKRKIK